MSHAREAGRLLALALPIATAHVGLVAMGWVDTAIVGRAGEVALAAVGLGSSLATLVLLLGLGLVLGLDTLAAQRLGAGDRESAREALRDALGLALPALAAMALATLALDRVVLAPGTGFAFPDDVASGARAYLWARVPGYMPFLAFAVFRAWLYADHRPGPVLTAIVVANVANAVLDSLFVFGNESLGIPRCGAVGAAWVTSACFLLTALWLWPHVLPDLASRGVARRCTRRQGLGRLFGLGLPVALQMTLDCGVFTLVAVLMNDLSPTLGGAHQITIQLVGCTFVVAVGLGNAASVRVGHAIGRGDGWAASGSGATAILLGIGWMAACGLAFLLVPTRLARVFTDEPPLWDAAAQLIRIAALFQVFDGIQAVCSGVLRGAGRTKLPFFANLCGQWLVGLPLGLWLAYRCGLGGLGLWLGLTIGIVAVGTILLLVTRVLLVRGVAAIDPTRRNAAQRL